MLVIPFNAKAAFLTELRLPPRVSTLVLGVRRLKKKIIILMYKAQIYVQYIKQIYSVYKILKLPRGGGIGN